MLTHESTAALGQALTPSLSSIVAKYRRFAVHALTQLGVEQAELDDAAQEVFMVVHRRLPEYCERQKLKAWLYAICVRVAHSFRRRRARSREHLSANPPELVATTCQFERFARRQEIEQAEQLLLAMPECQRAVFLLYVVQELPMSAVSARLNCRLQTGYSRLSKAREQLSSLKLEHSRES